MQHGLRRDSQTRTEEAKEKIELQIHQNSFRITESLKKQEMTEDVENAKDLSYAQEGFDAGVITSTIC